MAKKSHQHKQSKQKETNAERAARNLLAQKGHKIVLLIIAIDVIYAAISSIIEFSMPALMFNLVISFCIYFGISFVRYLYILNGVVFSILTIIGYQSFIEFGGIIYLILMAALCAWYLFSGYLLIKNKAVLAFFHKQKYGDKPMR